jgi:DnaK suppressor protein
MRTKDLAYFRKTLSRQLEELTHKSDAAVSGLLTTVEDSGDPVDQAERDLERSLSIRMLDRENKLILKIQRALRKIEDGTFGICEVCGQKIGIERLKSRPVAELCIDCKIRQEKLEKLACE